MINKYRFNNNDVFATYGIVFRPGTYNELLKLPKRKEGISINWANENGTERYLGAPRYETIVYNLPITLISKSEAEFWAKYNAFTSFLITSGEFNLDVVEMNRRFKVSYSDMTSFDKLTQIKGSNNIAASMTLQLFNDHPAERMVIP